LLDTMRIGYARVSTIEQDTKLQTAALKKGERPTAEFIQPS